MADIFDTCNNIQSSETLVGGGAGLCYYEVIDSKTNEPIKVLETDHAVREYKSIIAHHIGLMEHLIEKLSNSESNIPDYLLEIPQIFVEIDDSDVRLFLCSEQTDSYKPRCIEDNDVPSLIKEWISQIESSKTDGSQYKHDMIIFCYGMHFIAASLRIVGGVMHVATVDYIEGNAGDSLELIIKSDSSISSNVVFHKFLPKKGMQINGVSCSIYAIHALRELSKIPTSDFDIYFSKEGEESDYQKLPPNLMKLCQVPSIINKYVEAHPDAKINHKHKENEQLSDYLKRYTRNVVKGLHEGEPRLVKTNVAIYKKTIKFYKALLSVVSDINTDREFVELMLSLQKTSA